MKGQKDRKSKAKALSLPSLLGLRYLGRSDFADAGFLRQRPDAADKAERVRELLPAGLKDWALGRWHKLRRIAPRPRACHGNTRGPSGGGGGKNRWRKAGWSPPNPLTSPDTGRSSSSRTRTAQHRNPTIASSSRLLLFPSGFFLSGSGLFRKLTYCQIPPPPQKQNSSAATRLLVVGPSFFLSLPAAGCGF